MEDIIERLNRTTSLAITNASNVTSVFKDARDEITALRAAAATIKAERDAALTVGVSYEAKLLAALRQLSDACMRAGLCLEGDTWVNIVKAGAIGVGILHIEHKAADNVRAERDNLRRLVSDLRADLGLKDTEDLRPKVQALRAKFQELQSRVYEALEKVALDG